MSRKIGIGKEGQIHKNFAGIVKQYEAIKRLNCLFWTYNAGGEKRTPITGALLKAKGLACGFPDYVFFSRIQPKGNTYCRVVFIEFKQEKGKQSDSQKEFQAKFNCSQEIPNLVESWQSQDLMNVSYHVCRSVEEGLKVLQHWSIII